MAAPRPNRRDFLKGKAAAQAVEQIAGQVADALAENLPPIEPDHYLVKFSRRAMACQFELWLNAGEHPNGAVAAIEALDLVEQLEQQLTVYREDSEVSELNRTASLDAIEVEARLFGLLQQSVELWRTTQGAFDITAGPLTELWGFKRRAGRLPEASDVTEVLSRVGSQYLVLDAERHTVKFSREGVEINLGAIGKGYAVDRCAESLAAAGVSNYLFHAGNSSVLARGGNASRNDGAWSVGVRNPLKPERYLGELLVRERALSTSGSGTQFFIREGKRYGHILDPRTGWPVEDVLSTTVLAPTAAEAEALSTAFYVLGPETTERLCSQFAKVGCVMLCPGKAAGSVVTHVFNLSPEEWSTQQVDA